jgi:phosphoserine phosphatase
MMQKKESHPTSVQSTPLDTTAAASSPPRHLSSAEFHQAVLAARPRTAVFDCDGTLWSGDAGREFMEWSMDTGLVSRERAEAMRSRYRAYCAGEVSEIAICGEMAQLYTGLEDATLRDAAARFFREFVEARIFPALEHLISALRAQNTAIWAVSSTNHWVIEYGVTRFGIPPERVLCARVHVEAGRITDRLLDVPTDEGKALALERAGLPHPDAVFGNSVHDAAMLALGREAYAVNPTPALAKIAAGRGWPVFAPPIHS